MTQLRIAAEVYGDGTSFFFFFNDTATPEIYPLSLPDALPIYSSFQFLSRVTFKPATPSHPLRVRSVIPLRIWERLVVRIPSRQRRVDRAAQSPSLALLSDRRMSVTAPSTLSFGLKAKCTISTFFVICPRAISKCSRLPRRLTIAWTSSAKESRRTATSTPFY